MGGVVRVADLLKHAAVPAEHVSAIVQETLFQDILTELGGHVARENTKLRLAVIRDATPDVQLRRVLDGRLNRDIVGRDRPDVLIVCCREELERLLFREQHLRQSWWGNLRANAGQRALLALVRSGRHCGLPTESAPKRRPGGHCIY